MSDMDRIEERLKAIRGAPNGASVGVRAFIAGQEWAWRKLGVVLSAVIALVIAALTLSPMPPGVFAVNGIDKAYHFAAFACLIFPLIVTDSRRWFWAVPLMVLYGGMIELIQPTVGRSGEWLDFGANVTGVLAGAALAEILHDRIRRSVFDADSQLVPPDQTEAEDKRIEKMRAELMAELRVVLREELAAVPHLATDPRGVAPDDAAPADPRARLRSVQ
ncbi:VanZ family protein [Pararhodobacter sp.]|uniref:VanZ family protein n=1 Tax=Pararhodobacter sp. TaxID=2127056 RepID=UPI002AFE9D7D|nr:VanZ family protein [Pararhodobacter sp.]